MPVTFMMAHFHYVKYPPHGLTLMSRSDNFNQIQLPAALMCDGISAFLHLQDSVDGISDQSSPHFGTRWNLHLRSYCRYLYGAPLKTHI